MDDRELLQLAAKGAGLTIWKHGKNGGAFINGRAEAWSPFTNDSDALRLAVQLDLIPGYMRFSDMHMKIYEGDAKLAETRRTIVRAAAAIGASL